MVKLAVKNLTVKHRDFIAVNNLSSEERINELHNLIGFEKFMKNLIKSLSGGVRQRAMLTFPISHAPELLVPDESTVEELFKERGRYEYCDE